jgi:putative ABC transport system permease protein
MLISVKERTREFGVRKALGATPGSIVRLVLQEATILTVLAGYLGLVAGVLGLELVARFASTGDGPMGAPSIDLSAALVATAVLALGGILAGVAPARHAARIHPVVALRSE